MSTATQAEASGYGPALDSEPISAEPPANVRRLINELFASKSAQSASFGYITADQMPASVLQILSGFLASVANGSECNIIAVHECHSCYVNGSPGRVWDTDRGPKCVKC